jgi:hypothetical protein
MDIDRLLTDPGVFVDHDPPRVWQQLRTEDPVH